MGGEGGLTPDVMELFADFCRSYDFELFEDSLYFSKAEHAIDAGDQRALAGDVSEFLQKNGALLKQITL